MTAFLLYVDQTEYRREGKDASPCILLGSCSRGVEGEVSRADVPGHHVVGDGGGGDASGRIGLHALQKSMLANVSCIHLQKRLH
jgi:hypothetical protein